MKTAIETFGRIGTYVITCSFAMVLCMYVHINFFVNIRYSTIIRQLDSCYEKAGANLHSATWDRFCPEDFFPLVNHHSLNFM